MKHLCKTFLTALLLFGTFEISVSQVVSIRDWPMPAGDRYGLVKPGFRIMPTLFLENFGTETHLVLKMDVKLSTPQSPTGGFSYRYMYDGEEFTDQDLGFAPFNNVGYGVATFNVVVQGPGVNVRTNYETALGREKIATVPKDARIGAYTTHIQELVSIYYVRDENLRNAVIARKAEIRKKQADEKRLADAKIEADKQKVKKQEEEKAALEKKTAAEAATRKQAQEKAAEQNQNQNTAEGKGTAGQSKEQDSFWSDKPQRKPPGSDNAVPDNAGHKNLPDFVRTTDGGYFHRGANGKFREVTAAEYQQAKNAAAAFRVERNQPEPAKPEITVDDIMTSVKKDQAANQAIFDNIDQKFTQQANAWRQNFYHAEAIRSGKQNLSGLSRLEGNYNSVAELEAEFNQKYSSIRYEVSNLEQARNAQLNNAVTHNFNGNSTEQAIGQGIQLIGNMVNSGKAAKEAKEAQAALKLDRERNLAAIAAAKKRALLELRTKLLTSFPNGGLPLTAHKVTQPEVYIFTYITDKVAFNNEQALVSVSNVYPVAQYSDGTYPFKTTVLNKVKGYAPGEVTIVGYYNSKEIAEQMRNSFVNLAAKSNLQVKSFVVKGTTGSGATDPVTPGDFWETGKKTVPAIPTTDKKSDFWNN